MNYRLCGIAAFVALAGVTLAAPSPSMARTVDRHYPEVVFDISDEDMHLPLGLVIDVAVADGFVYLLDEQNCNVRRIALSGVVEEPLGRRGEGPGEIERPRRFALSSGGTSLILQSMSGRAVCLETNGTPCPSADLSQIKGKHATAIWMRAVASPPDCLIVSSIANRYPATKPGMSLEELGTVASAKRLKLSDGSIETLFTTEEIPDNGNCVRVPLRHYTLIINGWDVSAAGVVVYADPGGNYRAYVGHPADGPSSMVDLPQWGQDEERIARFLHDVGAEISVDDIPLIASIGWLDERFFWVRPAAHIRSAPEEGVVATFEVFRVDGSSYGRYDVAAEFDPGNDEWFVRGDLLIVIRGGKAVGRAMYADVARGSAGTPQPKVAAEEIRVTVYRLFESLRQN